MDERRSGMMHRIIDLSLPVEEFTASPPSQGENTRFATVFRAPGHWQATWLSLSAHTASHVDSPLHCLANQIAIGQMSLDRVIGEALVLDVSHVHDMQPVGSDDFRHYESKVKEGDILLIRSGWSERKWGNSDYFTSSPYLSEQGARWLADRKPKAVGFDFFQEYSAKTKDFSPEDFVIHRILMESGIVVMEGLTNLGALGSKRVMFFGAPLKLIGPEASPARFLALVESE
ncbi:MAG: cyclase family protein [Bacillota bacterium]